MYYTREEREREQGNEEMKVSFDPDNPTTIVNGAKKDEQCCKRLETER
jgi:hypothetical protein